MNSALQNTCQIHPACSYFLILLAVKVCLGKYTMELECSCLHTHNNELQEAYAVLYDALISV